MFTGLVSEIGTITASTSEGGGVNIALASTFADVAVGESIAVNGCCLTVTHVHPLSFHLSAETLSRTAQRWWEGERVNLERALKVGDRLSGHFVTGHVDGLVRLVQTAPDGDSRVLTLEVPKPLQKFIASKGSVTLDGVSLTVNTVENGRFTVNIIPHTLAASTLGERKQGDALNLEVDLIARYLESLRS